MDRNNNWEILLRYIYDYEEEWEYFKNVEECIASDHPFVKDTDLTVSEAQNAISFLKRHNLIEEKGDGLGQITSKGFEVARDQVSRGDHNKSFVAFTAILAIVAILDIIASELIPNNETGEGLLAIVLIVALLAIYLLIKPYLE